MFKRLKPIRSKDLDFKVIEKASELVYEKLRADESYPDLADQFTRRIDQPGSHRYFMNYKHLFGSMVEHISFIPFPRKIKDYLNRVETSTFMGILPEIDRVWITVDNILYIWNYKRPEEYDMYDGLSEVIVSVSLSTPKSGIFLESIKYILVVATAVEVVILALAFDENVSETMKIIPTSYAISSDNTTMLKVIGSQSGRIFMAGEDGNLYELDYHNSENLWSSLLGITDSNRHKCQKINHHQWNWRLVSMLPSLIRNLTGIEDPLIDISADNTRRILYTVTSKGYLSVFYLGVDYQSTQNCVYQYNIFDGIKKYVNNRIYLESSLQVDGLKDLANITIIGLFVIPVTESKKVHLITLLNTGVRIYLRLLTESFHNPTGMSTNISSTRIPSSIEIAFIRSPPPPNAIHCSQPRVALESGMESGVLPSYLPMQLLNMKNAYYCQGMFLSSLGGSGSNNTNSNNTNSAISGNNALSKGSNNEEDEMSDKLLAIYEDLMSHNFTPDTLLAGQIPNLREAINIVTSSDGRDIVQGKIYDIKEKDVSNLSPVTARVQTLFTISSTHVSSQVMYQEEETIYHQNSTISTDSMIETLPSSTVTTSLNPHGKGLSWGFGKNSSDMAIIHNEFVTSHIPILNRNQHRQFICLTNHGVHALAKLTPADLLVRLLSTAQQSTSLTSATAKVTAAAMGTSYLSENYLNDIRMFFERYGSVQSSIMCIALACGLPSAAGNYVDRTLSAWSSTTTGEVNANLANRAIMAMQRLTQGPDLRTPAVAAASMNVGSVDPRLAVRGSISYDYATSPVLDALFYMTSRIIRPLWLRAIVKSNHTVADYVDLTALDWMKVSLSRLLVYFEEYHPLVIRGDPIVNITTSATTTSTGGSGISAASSMRSSIGGNSSVMDSLFAMNQNLSQEKQLQQYARNLEDSTLNALYRLISRTIQALNLLSYLYDLNKYRGIPIQWSFVAKYTFKSWVISSNAHERLKKVIREVLLYFTSLGGNITTQPMPIIDHSIIINQFIDNLSKNCYYYFSLGDKYAYDASIEEEKIKQFLYTHIGNKGLTIGTSGFGLNENSNSSNIPTPGLLQASSPPNLMLRIPSYELRQQLFHMMKYCVELWVLAVEDWKAVDYVLPSGPNISSTVTSSSTSTASSSSISSTTAARSRASYDYASELSQICTSLRELGGYCRGGIVDICLTAAKNFYSNSDEVDANSSIALFRRSTNKNNNLNNNENVDNNDWEHEIYHGRPFLSDDALIKARRECYICLTHHFMQIIHITKFYPTIASSDDFNINNTTSQSNTTLFDTPLTKNNSKVISNMAVFEPTLQDMINRSMLLCENDPMYHEILFETFLKESPKHLIQMNTSEYIEKFLMIRDLLLLNRHYEYHEQYDKAANLMGTIAQTEKPLNISTRIEYLRSAVSNSSLVLERSMRGSDRSEFSSNDVNKSSTKTKVISPFQSGTSSSPYESYKDLLDVANIQLIAYEKLSSPPLNGIYPVTENPMIVKTQTQLLSISELFNEVAQPYKLWDVCLLLMQTSHYEDMEIITRLWRSIIYRLVPLKSCTDIGTAFIENKRLPDYTDTDEYVTSLRGRTQATLPIAVTAILEDHSKWRTELVHEIIRIGRSLHISIDSFESSYSYPMPRGWFISECLVKIPIPYHITIEAYVALFDRWIGKSAEKLLVALSSASYALKTWIQSVLEDRNVENLSLSSTSL